MGRLDRTYISEELRQRIDKQVRSGQYSMQLLGVASGFPNAQALSTQLHSSFPVSPLNISRWQRVAKCVGFAGKLLEGNGDHE